MTESQVSTTRASVVRACCVLRLGCCSPASRTVTLAILVGLSIVSLMIEPFFGLP